MDHFEYDLYEELGLTPACTEAEVKSAYKKKALVHHPDRNGGVQSEEFLRLKAAYDVLIDASKRQNYDAFHHSGEFRRDSRPLSAKEASWLVDQQKRSWGVKEIHPFAVCILCDSCPCPADGVCSGCGMTYCQMCVRKMHCRGGMMPHYPLKSSTKFSEDLAKNGREKEREHRLLKGSQNQWLMHDVDFRHQRDVYRVRAKNESPEMVWYWAWGQTRYTVHLAMWLPSEDTDADIQFMTTDEGKQRIIVVPNGCEELLDRVFAYEVDTSRSGEAFTFDHMHCMTFVMLKAHPGQRWRRLFEGDSEGLREHALGDPPHTVKSEQVDGFKPQNHYRVAGRKDTESEWYEVTINVPVPEMCERRHLQVVLEGTHVAVHVAGWMSWERRLQQRQIRWKDKHDSATHIDMQNSTWLLSRDEEKDFKCVQFVLAEWQEGADKNQEDNIRRQLDKDKNKVLLEDADPFHLYDLIEAEMFLRAGAVFKARSKLRKHALELVEEMEKHMEKLGEEGWRESPFADAWEDDEDFEARNENQLVVRDEEGGEVEEAAVWWEATELEEREEWNMEAEEQLEEIEARRLHAVRAAKEQEVRAMEVAELRRQEEERDRNVRRKEQALKNREIALKLQKQMAEANKDAQPSAKELDAKGKQLEAQIGIAQAREAAAAAARASPLAPKKIEAATEPQVGASAAVVAAVPAPVKPPPATASLHGCGWYFEDASDDLVKVTVPLEKACDGSPLPKDGAVTAAFSDLSFKLDVTLNGTVHKLDCAELMHRIDPKASVAKVRTKTKKVILELAKFDKGKKWKKLTAL